MTLADLFMRPLPRRRGRIVQPLGEMPATTQLTPAQIEQRRTARIAQTGKPKAANRIQR